MALCHINESKRHPVTQQSPYTIITQVITTAMDEVMNKKGIIQTTHQSAFYIQKGYDKLQAG